MKRRTTMHHAPQSLVVIALSGVLVLAAGCSRGAGAQSGESGRVTVTVDGDGYHPAQIQAEAGKPLHITFRRTTDRTCGQVVVFPALNIRRDLPLNQDVTVEVTPQAGTLAFTCGMDMYRGSIVAN
jgi:plastocyanin domain-containing protein